MTVRKIGKKAPRSHVKGWQTLTEAAHQSGVSRQRLHILLQDKRIPHRTMLGLILVPAPLTLPKRKRREKVSKR